MSNHQGWGREILYTPLFYPHYRYLTGCFTFLWDCVRAHSKKTPDHGFVMDPRLVCWTTTDFTLTKNVFPPGKWPLDAENTLGQSEKHP